MTRLAGFGMYDFRATHDALDALWDWVALDLVARGMADVPAHLAHDRSLEAIWREPDLLLAQTCGYPLRKHLGDAVRYVATPSYDAHGCVGPMHRSFIVVAADAPYASLAELRGARAAVNGYDSNSGMNLFRAALAPIAGGRPMFASVRVTDAHANSLAAIAEGSADVAAIDCVSFWFVMRERPLLADRVRILAETPVSPGLPLITRRGTSDRELAMLRDALAAAVASPATADARKILRLTGFTVLPDEAYDVVLAYEAGAAAAGYPELA